MIHPADAQEAIDDARAEAERAAATEIAELRAERDDLAQQLAELEPMRAVMDALHKELQRSDTIEYLPEVPGHSPAMLRLGRMVLSGMSAGALLEPLRDAALDFTQDDLD